MLAIIPTGMPAGSIKSDLLSINQWGKTMKQGPQTSRPKKRSGTGTANLNSAGRKALLLGGAGAMGVYLVPELASKGYDVRVVSLDQVVSDNPRISHVKADAGAAIVFAVNRYEPRYGLTQPPIRAMKAVLDNLHWNIRDVI